MQVVPFVIPSQLIPLETAPLVDRQRLVAVVEPREVFQPQQVGGDGARKLEKIGWFKGSQSDGDDLFLSTPSSLPPRTAQERKSSVRHPHLASMDDRGGSEDGDAEIGLWCGMFESSPSFWDPLGDWLWEILKIIRNTIQRDFDDDKKRKKQRCARGYSQGGGGKSVPGGGGRGVPSPNDLFLASQGFSLASHYKRHTQGQERSGAKQ